MENSSHKFYFVVITILVAAIARLVPHWPNFTPVAAIALFGGAYLKDKRFAFLVPLLALFISDICTVLFINYKYTNLSTFFTSYAALSVYVGFAIVVALGTFLRNNIKVGTLALASLSSSVLFFLLTNFAVFINNPMFPQNGGGLVSCYIYALPFFGYAVAGDLVYCALLFGVFYLAQKRIPALAHQ